jgi:opacity protein-like surface antigen
MRIGDFVIAAAVIVGLSAPALAQQASAQAAQTPAYPATTNTSSGEARNWMVSGFLGTNFGSSRNGDNADLLNLENFDSSSTSANFGGQVAYLGRGVIGGEFLAEFSPRINTFNNILFERQPNVNTYMINAITAAPIGHLGSFNPYVSGGVGWVALHADIFTINPNTVQPVDGVLDTSALGSQSVSGSRFGWDLGGGLMAWSDKKWGFRGDVRYYRAVSNSTDVLDPNNIDGATFTQVELSGISFWKANVGLGFRF